MMCMSNLSTFYFFQRLLFILLSSLSVNIYAAPATIEVDSIVLPASVSNTFTSFLFQTPFESGTTPNVFTMTTDDGTDPCTVRITNVTSTGFDAVCFEPINEDGTHPGMTVEYIAIADGGVTVPLDGGVGNVVFESACINTTTQQYGNPCNDCSGTRGYDSIGFTTTFTNAPAVLAQLQTTNNVHPLPDTDPLFIDISIQTNSLTSSGFNVAVEQMEAGIGPLGSTEKICYLAVERNGCQDLDLSSLGGPASPIIFNAVYGGQNVDGWNNGCTSGEGATFDACFTSTPIAIAKQRSRRGGDGGVLRRCNVSSSEIILTYDEDQISNNERRHIDELTSVIAFSGTFTTPVTLNQANVSQFGHKTLFEWQTSAETFHLGFHLWGELDGEWIQLNSKLIKGDGIDHDGVRDYQHSFRMKSEYQNIIKTFGISSVDSSGHEEFYGPFDLDQEYGEQAINEAVDWNETRTQFNTSMRSKGFQLIKGRWRKSHTKKRQQRTNRELGVNDLFINLTVANKGIHSVTYENISQLTDEWLNVPIKKIALTLNGNSLPRHIISEDTIFNHGDQIIFVGKLPANNDAIYLTEYQYQLRIDSSQVISETQFNGKVNKDQKVSSYGLITNLLTSAKAYSAALNNGDPWYDSQLFTTGNVVSKVYSFQLPNDFNPKRSAQLDLTLFGSIDFPENEFGSPDHHVQIRINGELIEDVEFDGLLEFKEILNIPKQLLSVGENSLTITLPGDTAYPADIVLIDELNLVTQQRLSAVDGIDFVGNHHSGVYGLVVNDDLKAVSVYAYQSDGALSHINNTSLKQNLLRFAALPRHNRERIVHYAVGNESTWHRPTNIELIQPQDLHSTPNDLLIVAHPSFINDALKDYAAFKSSDGYKPLIVDWLDIVNTYGYGNDTPKALDNYLKVANNYSKLSNVLLVGGHTYDYINITGQNVVNFIPTHYRPVSVFANTPSDNPYADLDNDNIPELAIGRWPVRSQQDLSAIIKKSRDWQSNIKTTQYQNALLIAQPNDSRNLSFVKQLEGRVSVALRQNSEFDTITTVYMDEIEQNGDENPVIRARKMISDNINAGIELVSYAGHASPSAWGFQNIVNTGFIQELDNSGKPSIIMPLACYTTYYESTSVNTLAHQWLFAGDKGAVAIHGASVLGEYRENAIFAERYLKNSKQTQTIGKALLAAKREMSSGNQMLTNWALLGDPTLPLR